MEGMQKKELPGATGKGGGAADSGRGESPAKGQRGGEGKGEGFEGRFRLLLESSGGQVTLQAAPPGGRSWACTFLTHSQGVGRPMGCPFPGTAARKAAGLGATERASHGTHI